MTFHYISSYVKWGFTYDGTGPRSMLTPLKYSYLAGAGFIDKVYLQCERPGLHLQCQAQEREGEDGAPLLGRVRQEDCKSWGTVRSCLKIQA